MIPIRSRGPWLGDWVRKSASPCDLESNTDRVFVADGGVKGGNSSGKVTKSLTNERSPAKQLEILERFARPLAEFPHRVDNRVRTFRRHIMPAVRHNHALSSRGKTRETVLQIVDPGSLIIFKVLLT